MMVVVFPYHKGQFNLFYLQMNKMLVHERCNGKNNCNDGSDEQSCQTLYWENGNKDVYSENIPPAPLDENVSKKLPGNQKYFEFLGTNILTNIQLS